MQLSEPPADWCRRRLIGSAAALGAGGVLVACQAPQTGDRSPFTATATATARPGPAPSLDDAAELTAAPASVNLVPAAGRETAVWAYGGSVPGTTLRFTQGDWLNIRFNNQLPDASTVHWHGIRLPNAMDGVPDLTQPPVEPGEQFHYRFALPDAGTYWYHPHLGTPEQVGRGLYGALIVQEAEPPAVDRELVWLVDDWRLNRQAQIADNFYHPHDMHMGGRIGNTITVNGKDSYIESVRRGERIRLRLINTANARPVALDFGEHPAWLIALDGHPLESVARLQAGQIAGQTVLLGPGQRADLIIDMTAGKAGERLDVVDRFSPRRAHWVARFQYESGGSATSTRRESTQRDAPRALPPNQLAQPTTSDRLDVNIAMNTGRPQRRARPAFWTLNGKAHQSHGADHPMEFTAHRGQTVRIKFENRSRLWHPMHLHGHVFQELTRNGRPAPLAPWRDTTMIGPREEVVVQFVADNPGDWLLHCHILEHHAAGMGTQFRVTA